MVALKGQAIDRFVRNPDRDVALVLVYGPDTGLVSERVKAIVAAMAGSSDDPFAVVQLDGDAIAGDPSRLADEAYTIAMFGGRRAIRLRATGNRNLMPLIEPLMALPPEDAVVVIEAGDLNKSSPLRRRFEQAKGAVAIPCYADNSADLARLVTESLAEDGLTIEPDARAVLVEHLGGDRLASRAEIDKLRLYMRGEERVTLTDVDAICGDASAVAIDDVVDAAATGRLASIDQDLERIAAAGIHMSAVVTRTLRHFQMLDRLRVDVDGGQRAAAIVEHQRPPIHFRRKAAITTALEAWDRKRLERALDLIDEAQVATRLQPDLAVALVGDLMFRLAGAARARRGR